MANVLLLVEKACYGIELPSGSCLSFVQITYLLFLIQAWIICLYAAPYLKINKLNVFPLLLTISLLTEAVVNIFRYAYGYKREDISLIYHIYVPLEYTLLAYYFCLNSPHNFKKYIGFSIPVFILISFLISLSLVPEKIIDHKIIPEHFYYKERPSLNLNIGGVLLIIFSIISLFSMKPTLNINITMIPLFWICVGLLVYHSVTFAFNGFYNYLLNKDIAFADMLNKLVNQGLNCVLYSCLSIAFLCSRQTKKYIA